MSTLSQVDRAKSVILPVKKVSGTPLSITPNDSPQKAREEQKLEIE